MTKATHRSSSEELARSGDITRERVLERLRDWYRRVSELYDAIERALEGTDLRVVREGIHFSHEELPQRFNITDAEQVGIPHLRIERKDGSLAARFSPRGLWVIGANGRIDLIIMRAIGREAYILIDQSEPMSGPAKWVRVPVGLLFDREPFDPVWLLQKLR